MCVLWSKTVAPKAMLCHTTQLLILKKKNQYNILFQKHLLFIWVLFQALFYCLIETFWDDLCTKVQGPREQRGVKCQALPHCRSPGVTHPEGILMGEVSKLGIALEAVGQVMKDHPAEHCCQMEGYITEETLSLLTTDTLHLLVVFADTVCWARWSLHPQWRAILLVLIDQAWQ